MSRVAIVIVNWNTRDLVLECLESLERQLPADTYEAIVVDNASADDSVAAIRARFPGVQVLPSDENLGFGRANNLGVAHTHAPWVLFLNSDAFLIDDSLLELLDRVEGDASVGAVGARVLNHDRTLQDSAKGARPTLASAAASFLAPRGLAEWRGWPRIWDDRDHPEPVEVDWVTGAFLLMPRPLLLELDGFDPRFFMYCEDMDLCLRARARGRQVRYDPRATVVHYRGKSMEQALGRNLLLASNTLIGYYGRTHGPLARALFWLLVRTGYVLRVGAALGDRERRTRLWRKLRAALGG